MFTRKDQFESLEEEKLICNLCTSHCDYGVPPDHNIPQKYRDLSSRGSHFGKYHPKIVTVDNEVAYPMRATPDISRSPAVSGSRPFCLLTLILLSRVRRMRGIHLPRSRNAPWPAVQPVAEPTSLATRRECVRFRECLIGVWRNGRLHALYRIPHV